MPNYDYQCLDCGYTFEEFQKMSDEPLKICPKCKGSLKRLIGSGLAPIFKGSGFYQTDYKNSSGKNASSASSPGKETKTDSKTTESKTSENKDNSKKKPA